MIKGKLKYVLIIAGIITLAVAAIVLLFGDKFFDTKPHSPGSADLDPLAQGTITLNVPDEPYTYNGSGTFDPLRDVTAVDSDGTDLTNAVQVSVTESASYTEKELVYTVTGKSLRSITATRELRLENYSGPAITIATETIQCDISKLSTLSELIFNNKFVTAEDGFGHDISQSLTVEKRNDILKSGLYNMTVTAENFLHDKVTASIAVEVSGELHDNPIILASDTAVIDVGDKFDPTSYILSAEDPEYGDLLPYVRFTTDLNIFRAGEYYMNFFISGFDGVSSAPVTLHITVIGELGN